jgi:hypothetical protein
MVAPSESRTVFPETSRPGLSRFRAIPAHKSTEDTTGLLRANSRRMNTCEKRVCKSFRFNTYKSAVFNPLWNQHLQKKGWGEGLMVNQTSPSSLYLDRTNRDETLPVQSACKLLKPFRTNPRRPLQPSPLGARIGLIRGTDPLSPVSNSTDSGPRVAPLPRLPKSAKGPRLFLAGCKIRPSWRGASREVGRKGRQCPIG